MKNGINIDIMFVVGDKNFWIISQSITFVREHDNMTTEVEYFVILFSDLHMDMCSLTVTKVKTRTFNNCIWNK